jgi:hypothetical protein
MIDFRTLPRDVPCYEVDLPPIPPELLKTKEWLLENQEPSYEVKEHASYRTDEPLKEWLKQHFSNEIISRYQLLHNGIPLHIYKESKLPHKVYYMLERGGDNVKTNFYETNIEDLENNRGYATAKPGKLIQSAETLEGRWYALDVLKFHEVVETEKPRFFLAVTLNHRLEKI